MWNMQKIKQIRQYLDSESFKAVVSSLVLSHLDYANIILAGCSDIVLNKMQKDQTMVSVD